MNKSPFQPGFTLIELMVTIAVMAVVLTLGVPSFQQTIRNNRLAAQTNNLIAALNLARSEAVKRGMRVTVRKTSTNWENGWQVFTDTDNPVGSGNYGTQEGTDETLRVYDALPGGYTLRGNNNFTNYISFLSSGQSNNMGSFAVCDNSDGTGIPKTGTSRLIIVNSTGRVRLGTDTNNNGIPEKENSDGTVTDITSCTAP